jgi:hypothetical protein
MFKPIAPKQGKPNENSIVQTSIFVSEEEKQLHQKNIGNLQSKYNTKAFNFLANTRHRYGLENYHSKISNQDDESRNNDSFAISRSSSTISQNMLKHFSNSSKQIIHSHPFEPKMLTVTSYNRKTIYSMLKKQNLRKKAH